ncbi:MAG TPA: hypothetical protein DD723_03165 [Candidatus Omnitrophica bacterium]|nr:MAG: hypothetical protein A2Z81_01110 [Omnitrophica WOR_2 bacterium GWA2_45_18]HBR14529.1 hypothetical protein [Candidatus Omnitrophota bacterium]
MKKGFTLVELLVVLVVIGVIIALILPNAMKAIARAQDKECASNIRTIQTAMDLCYSQTRDYSACNTMGELTSPITSGGVSTPAPLSTTPVCPFGVGYVISGGSTGVSPTIATATHFSVWPPRNVLHVGNTN